MVASVTSLGRNGLYDWMVQRVTAVVLGLYTLFILGFLISTPDLTYAQWSGLFSQTWVRIFTLLSLISLAAHAWVGLWTVSTDYIKATGIRFIFQAACGITAFAYVVWGVQVIWGL